MRIFMWKMFNDIVLFFIKEFYEIFRYLYDTILWVYNFLTINYNELYFLKSPIRLTWTMFLNE